MQESISLIIPVYNEAENIDELCAVLDAFAQEKPYALELVFVDDGSRDASLQKLHAYPFAHVRAVIVSFSKNFGAHAAIRAGLQEATSPYAMTFLADLQDPVELIDTMFSTLQAQGLESVFASRGKQGNNASKGESRLSRAYSALIRKFAVPDYPPSGFNNFFITRKIIDLVTQHMEPNSSIHLQILDMGFRHAFVVCDYHERKRGASKWSYSKKIKLWIDSFVSFSFAPIRVISVLGIALAVVGALYGLFIVIAKVFHLFDFEAGFPTLIAVLMLGFGATNLSLGIIAEYLWRTFDVARKKPLFLVDRVSYRNFPGKGEGKDA